MDASPRWGCAVTPLEGLTGAGRAGRSPRVLPEVPQPPVTRPGRAGCGVYALLQEGGARAVPGLRPRAA